MRFSHDCILNALCDINQIPYALGVITTPTSLRHSVEMCSASLREHERRLGQKKVEQFPLSDNDMR